MTTRAIRLFLLGAVLGPLFDRAHLWTGAIAYDTPVTPLGVPWWVSLVYIGAALGIGLTHPAMDRVLGRPQRMKLSGPLLAIGFAAMGVLWIASGLLPLPNVGIAAVLLAGAAAMWWTLDRTWQGVVLAAGTGLGGVIVEATLVRLGLFHHTRPDVIGLPVWLPVVYFGGSIAIGNLARSWAAREAPAAAAPGPRSDATGPRFAA